MPQHAITLDDAPAIAGLVFRHPWGEEDAEALRAVRAGSAAHDGIDPRSTLEGVPSSGQMRSQLAEAAARGECDRWLVAQIRDRVAGCSRVLSWPESDGATVCLTLGWVLPEWRGKGIGTAMLHWTEDRLRRLAAAQQPGGRCEFAANASSTESDARALLLHEGYQIAYTLLEMGISSSVPAPPATSLPAGIDLLAATPEHYSAIAASIGEAYQDEYEGGRFGEVFDAAGYAASLSRPVHDPTLWQVAWEGSLVVGQVLPVIENGRAELFEVSVRPGWRRRGLARALLLRALHSLRARGTGEIRIHTNKDFRTRASDLYRSVGFRVLKEFPRYRKPFQVLAP